MDFLQEFDLYLDILLTLSVRGAVGAAIPKICLITESCEKFMMNDSNKDLMLLVSGA